MYLLQNIISYLSATLDPGLKTESNDTPTIKIRPLIKILCHFKLKRDNDSLL